MTPSAGRKPAVDAAASGTADSAASGGADSSASSAGTSASGTPVAPKKAPAKPRTPRASAAKSTAAKSPAAKSSASKSTAAQSTAAKTTSAKTTAAKTNAAKTTSTSTSAGKTAAAKSTAAKTAAPKTSANGAPAATSTSKTAAAKTAAAQAAPVRPQPVSEPVDSVTPSPEPDSAASKTSAAKKAPASKSPTAKKAPTKRAPVRRTPVKPATAQPEVTDPSANRREASESVATKPAAENSAAQVSAAAQPVAETVVETIDHSESSDAVEDVLVVRGLTRHYGGTHAVDNLDLRVPTGTFSAIVGPNGAGKTTALSMITGLLRPDAGEILVNGVNVWEDPDRAKRTIGALPDRMRLFERLTGAQFLHYSGTLRGLSAATVRTRIADLAAAIGLSDALGRLVSDYSVGMRKKVALAAALIHSPRLLVLDEPFESVDPVSVDRLLTLLRNYVDHGGTVVLSSHGMELIERVCDHVSIIVSGTVLAQGTVAEVRGNGTLAERFAELSLPADPAEGLEWLHSFSD
ncbi:ATP-binding cassette domain-containing protein [Mycetocola sp. JXN-3]|uniref:ATP-binding cassette domain-containing protein n=1 Tax=Mycetocola sp. JXN-3 TaxID=2116510 RepID=UPI0021041D31|nr:ATP-binding cassette domain-containing protein [Mycetocola sp. JXN-3]